MSVAPIIPPTGWTDDEFDALPESGYRHELIDGVLHVPPAPIGRHQFVGRRLANAIEAGAPPGYVVLHDLEVKLSDSLRYVPDVLVVTADAYGDGSHCRHAPEDVLLAVEVVSESSRGIDRILKPAQYAAAGIPHYWRVELAPRLVVVTYELGGEYQETGKHVTALNVDRPGPIKIDLASLTH
jgi:Uma2 family endonuclease